jgi:hypothetical protein
MCPRILQFLVIALNSICLDYDMLYVLVVCTEEHEIH